jgi:hypothetical protein
MSVPINARAAGRPKSDTATIVFRRDMTIVMADSTAGDLFGRPAVELVGTPAGCLLQQSSDLSLYALLVREPDYAFRSPQSTIELELFGVHSRRGHFPVQATVTEGSFLGHRIFMAALVPVGRRREDPRLLQFPGRKPPSA